jgi:PAS domain S-box-containing protein
MRSGNGMADGLEHEDLDRGAPSPPGTVEATSARRLLLSRPTPSHLFAQRKTEAGDNGGGSRPPRVIPALASHPKAEAPTPPAATAKPAATAEPAENQAPDYPPDLVFIVRADGTVLYINRPLGPRGEEDVIGSYLYDWVFPEQHALVRDTLARVFSSGQAGGLELSGIQQHQPDAWYECRIAPNHRDGKVVSATIIARDVTRYKRAEQALRSAHDQLHQLAQERAADIEQLNAQLARLPAERDEARADADRFRSLLDAAGEAVFVADATTETLVDANETACRWLKRDRSWLRGRPVQELGLEFPVLPPASLDLEFTETRDTRRPLILEGLHRRQDRSTFPVEVAVTAHTIGQREYVLAVARDVKGRRRIEDALAESDDRYRALVAQSFDAVFLTTRGGEIIEANQPALALFGYEMGGLVGLDARTLLPRVDDIRRFQRAMADEGIVRRLEVELRRRDDSTFPGVVSATWRRDAQGRLLGYQWVSRRAGEPARDAPASSAPAPAVSVLDDVLLLVEGDARGLEAARAALSRLGPPVLAAPTAADALRELRAHTPRVRLAVVGPVPDSAPEDLARELRAVFPELKVILATPEDPFGMFERAVDLAVEACLRHPVHPLTLVQSVREALGGLPGA